MSYMLLILEPRGQRAEQRLVGEGRGGAPEHLLDRAMARREVRRQEREGLALGLASGAWQHW